jgi:hypothetical protein
MYQVGLDAGRKPLAEDLAREVARSIVVRLHIAAP